MVCDCVCNWLPKLPNSHRQLTFFHTQVTPPKKEGTWNFRFPGTFLDTCLIFALSKLRYYFFFFFIKYSSKQKKTLENYVI